MYMGDIVYIPRMEIYNDKFQDIIRLSWSLLIDGRCRKFLDDKLQMKGQFQLDWDVALLKGNVPFRLPKKYEA